MAKVASFLCADIPFDIYDGERVPLGNNKHSYYITPKMLINIEVWMIENFILKIKTKEQMNELISRGLIGTY